MVHIFIVLFHFQPTGHFVNDLHINYLIVDTTDCYKALNLMVFIVMRNLEAAQSIGGTCNDFPNAITQKWFICALFIFFLFSFLTSVQVLV